MKTWWWMREMCSRIAASHFQNSDAGPSHSSSSLNKKKQKLNFSQHRQCHWDSRLSLSIKSGLKSSESQIRRPHAQSDTAQLLIIEQKKIENSTSANIVNAIRILGFH